MGLTQSSLPTAKESYEKAYHEQYKYRASQVVHNDTECAKWIREAIARGEMATICEDNISFRFQDELRDKGYTITTGKYPEWHKQISWSEPLSKQK